MGRTSSQEPEATASLLRRWRTRGIQALRIAYGLIRGGEARRIAWLAIRPRPGMFQPFGFTALDRYPVVFRYIQRQLGAERPVALLSFGCASGEEVFTLRRYFPNATVKGLDVDPIQIRRSQAALAARGGDPRISFEVAGSPDAEADASYDAIFAMAVFRHGDLHLRPPSCEKWVRFEDFEAAVTSLARALRPGGYLALRNANFRFADTALASQFERRLAREPNPATPAYGRDNRLIEDDVPDDGVFQKAPFS
jgi:SAM-dependent methyltransferase